MSPKSLPYTIRVYSTNKSLPFIQWRDLFVCGVFRTRQAQSGTKMAIAVNKQVDRSPIPNLSDSEPALIVLIDDFEILLGVGRQHNCRQLVAKFELYHRDRTLIESGVSTMAFPPDRMTFSGWPTPSIDAERLLKSPSSTSLLSFGRSKTQR